MAAIIAQLTRYRILEISSWKIFWHCRAQRERNNRVTYSTNKCLYELPPFDQHFDPLVHNKYLSRWDPTDPRPLQLKKGKYCRKAKLLERQARREEKSPSLEVLLRQNSRSSDNNGKFTYKKCLLETVIIGKGFIYKYILKIFLSNQLFNQIVLFYLTHSTPVQFDLFSDILYSEFQLVIWISKYAKISFHFPQVCSGRNLAQISSQQSASGAL